jgi:glycolate oxidase iron-sulfur subunit
VTIAASPTGTAASTVRDIFTPELLDACISCGFCLPVCPTYALTKEESSSPRGRITLMRALATGRLDGDDPTLQDQSSFCLGCRACESVCPAGVQYGVLLEEWRDHQWRGRRRPLLARLVMLPARLGWPLRLAALVRRPARTRRPSDSASAAPGLQPSAGGGPWLMLGCYERLLFPRVSRAARQLRPELGAPADQGCCGAIHAHSGKKAIGEAMARRLGAELPGTIVTTSGGCSAHLANVVGRDRVREFSEYIEESWRAEGPPALEPLQVAGRPARVGLQDSCHLRNGLGVTLAPRTLIAQVAEYVEVPGAGDCCGAAGTYALVRAADSRRVLDRRLDAIEGAGVDYLVVVNPGCQRQLLDGLRKRRSPVRVLHIAELLERSALD